MTVRWLFENVFLKNFQKNEPLREIQQAHEVYIHAVDDLKFSEFWKFQIQVLKSLLRNPFSREILQAHEGGVSSIAFSKDGKRLVSAGMSVKERTVSVWEWKNDKKDSPLCSQVCVATALLLYYCGKKKRLARLFGGVCVCVCVSCMYIYCKMCVYTYVHTYTCVNYVCR